jgi:hypothetical protein
MKRLPGIIAVIVLSLTASSCGNFGSCTSPVGYYASLKNRPRQVGINCGRYV